MKICFYSKDENLTRGSYRIHVHDLNFYLNKIGVDSVINPKNIEEYDVIICDKGTSVNKNPNQLQGVITPSREDGRNLKKFDFIIVGSAEEKASLVTWNKNSFIFPQIEKMYLGSPLKIHEQKEELVIGYHGNPNHLNHLSLGLKNALERLSETVSLKLLITKSRLASPKYWTKGRPDIKIEWVDWNLKTIKDAISQFDIGIVPNISEFALPNSLNTNIPDGVYKSDIKIRFKNKSNIGRALVLFQMGIPVVADITPSNMHLLANPNNGHAVLDEQGWYSALQDLCCPKRRQLIAQNAHEECERLYNPLKWAEILYKNILTITKNTT